MWILIFFLVIVIIGTYLHKFLWRFPDLIVFIWTYSCVLVFFIIIFWILFCTEQKSEINQFYTTRNSIERAREKGDYLEKAAIQLKIIETNQWLANKKYYNSVWFFDFFIPDEVDDIDFLR
jgi:hypothetical protein